MIDSDSSMETFLVTGANRGVCFELTRQLLNSGQRVVAGCRSPDDADRLTALSGDKEHLLVVQMDVADESSVRAAAATAAKHFDQIDVLINNAGILLAGETIESIDIEKMQRVLDVNTIGPVRVVKYFLPLMTAGSAATNRTGRIINISSQLGSLDLNGQRRCGEFSYNASKAGLNVVTRMLAHDLKEQQIVVVSVHPGWVRTDMGGSQADVSPTESAAGILSLAKRLTAEDTNKFFTYTGQSHEW